MSQEKINKKDLPLIDKLILIQVSLNVVKSKYNDFGKFKYRSAEDILQAVKPFQKELGVLVLVSESLIPSGHYPFPVIESKAEIRDSTGIIFATSIVGVELEQKKLHLPQKFGVTSSYGKKYALGNLFALDDAADSDAINNGEKHIKTENKPSLKNLGDAKAFISKGGSIVNIKKKYSISSDQEKNLKEYQDNLKQKHIESLLEEVQLVISQDNRTNIERIIDQKETDSYDKCINFLKSNLLKQSNKDGRNKREIFNF